MSITYLWEICFVVNLSVCFVTTAVARERDLFSLDIVHYNDFHDRFEETSVSYPICTSNDDSCLGGFPRLYHEIKTLLREKPDALLLDAGDTYQGTYWYTLLKWNITQRFINMLPNDAHTLGNHEFDDGIDGLVPYLAGLRGPMLVANIDTSEEPSLKGLYQPHMVIEKRGRKIGIIGLTTPNTKMSSRPGKVIFKDPIKTASKEAQLLTEEGVDIIVLLSHCGLDVDIQIAKEVGKNIDVIVGGHTHSLLWNSEQSPSKEEISGPYPVIVESEDKSGHKVLVVTASAFTKYLGNLTVNFDKAGELVTFTGEPVFLNRSIPEDPEIKELLQPYADYLHKMVNEVVAYTKDDLREKICGSAECAVGNLIADSFLNATKETKPSDLPAVAFLTRNMIRGSLSKGNITVGVIINTMPFTNKVVTYALPGRHLWDALEKCMSTYWKKVPFTGPWMPEVAGMKLTLNTTSQKVVSLLVQDGEIFKPVQMDQDYQVTTPDFLAKGGSGFEMLKNYSRDMKVIGVDSKLFETYLKKVSPVADYLDNRLTIVT